MMDPLTVRLESEQVVVSSDDGLTAPIYGEAASAMRNAAETVLLSLETSEWSYGRPTASTLGIVAESRLVRPQEAGRPTNAPADGPAVGGRRVRIGHLATANDRRFHDVLASRRSQRVFARITIADLANVLAPATRVQAWWSAPDGFNATQRPTPSAGGRHPIDLVTVTTNVVDLDPGLWLFDPYTCELVEYGLRSNCGAAAVAQARAALEGGAEPAAAVFAIAHFGRTLSRYPGGSSLVLRDAGALLATMQLCANAAGLASCIVGTSGALLSRKSADHLVEDVGALLLGR